MNRKCPYVKTLVKAVQSKGHKKWTNANRFARSQSTLITAKLSTLTCSTTSCLYHLNFDLVDVAVKRIRRFLVQTDKNFEHLVRHVLERMTAKE